MIRTALREVGIMSVWRRPLAAAMFGILVGCAGLCSAAQPATALRVEAKGPITPAISRHVSDGIASAESAGASAVLLELDTPGGLLDSTREIVQAILGSPLPVIVYVAPSGARATSAGVFILMASDVAAMAPGTHLGAAHPVNLGEGQRSPPPEGSKGPSKERDASILKEKAVSDAAAYARGLAADKGRNAIWAEKAVRESLSLTAAEALKEGVVEAVAQDRAELFRKLDGRRVKKHGRAGRLRLAEAAVREFPMSALRRVLVVIANPNLALLLLMLGIYGLIYEFSSPGVGFGAVVGLTSLILAGYALSLLPVNYAGLLIILLALVLLIMEVQVPSYGLLSIGGLVLLALGSFFLFDAEEAYLRLSFGVIGGVVAATGAFFLLVVPKLLRTRRLRPAVGVETLVGMVGEARETIAPAGLVFVNSELWTARARARIEKGTRIKVLEVRGGVLIVESIGEQS